MKLKPARRGRRGKLEEDTICAHDDEHHHGGFVWGLFYVFSETDFSFHTF